MVKLWACLASRWAWSWIDVHIAHISSCTYANKKMCQIPLLIFQIFSFTSFRLYFIHWSRHSWWIYLIVPVQIQGKNNGLSVSWEWIINFWLAGCFFSYRRSYVKFCYSHLNRKGLLYLSLTHRQLLLFGKFYIQEYFPWLNINFRLKLKISKN